MHIVYTVRITDQAVKMLKKLDTAIRNRIRIRIDQLAANPRSQDSIKLAGNDDLYRIRVGDYRVVYEIRDAELIVVIVRVAHRRDVYR